MKGLLIALIAVLTIFMLGLATQVDNIGEGSPIVWPQVVNAAPSQPSACVAAQRGRLLYYDDTNDSAASYICYCGVNSDDATYQWMKVNSPNTACF